MENQTYTKQYLSEQGAKWTFTYDFKENSGDIFEHENNQKFSFKFHYNKFTFTTKEGKDRFNELSETEKKWMENCADEVAFIRKK